MPKYIVALLAAVLALLASACGGAGDERASTPLPRDTLRLAEFPWSAAGVTNAILERIVELRPELGIEHVERVPVNPESAWSKLLDGEIDVVTEVYLPNQEEFLAEAGDRAELLHRTYAGAANGWFVPRFAVEPGGPAAGLSSIEDLRRHADAFGSRLYDGEPGWVSTKQNADRIEGFALDLEHVTASEADLVAELRRSYNARRPILVYLWRPHWAHAAFDLVMLDEPNAYSVDCFRGEKQACAMPTNDVWVGARPDVADRWPRLWQLLSRFEIPLADMERMLFLREQRGTPVDAIARRWVRDHEQQIAAWVGA